MSTHRFTDYAATSTAEPRWLLSHALQLMATISLLLGAYLAVSGLVRLS
jgi:hypothetical protein